jgi:hypothetical protein
MPVWSLVRAMDPVRLRPALCGLVAGHAGAAVAIGQGSPVLGGLVWFAGLTPMFLLGFEQAGRHKASAAEFIRNLRGLSGIQRGLAATFLILAGVLFHVPAEMGDLCIECAILLVPVALAALFFGVGTGLYAATTMTLIEWFSAIPPRFTFGFQRWSDVVFILAFSGLAICSVLIFQSIYRVLATRRT